MNLNLTYEERKLLLQVINFSVSKAADSFASIAKEEVLVSAPQLNIVEEKDIASELSHLQTYETIVETDLYGDLQGKSFLLFTQAQCDLLADVCFNSLNIIPEEIEKMRSSLVLETGNIIAGTLCTHLTNVFGLKVLASNHFLRNNVISNLLKEIAQNLPYFKPIIFTIQTKFIYSYKDLQLPLIMVFDLHSLMRIVEQVRNFDPGTLEI